MSRVPPNFFQHLHYQNHPGKRILYHCMLQKSSRIICLFCQRSQARMPEYQIIAFKQMGHQFILLKTTPITKLTIFITVLEHLCLTDPVHSTKRYGNHNGFRDISCFMGSGWADCAGRAGWAEPSSLVHEQKPAKKKKKKPGLTFAFTFFLLFR